jgi:hypothetical protein
MVEHEIVSAMKLSHNILISPLPPTLSAPLKAMIQLTNWFSHVCFSFVASVLKLQNTFLLWFWNSKILSCYSFETPNIFLLWFWNSKIDFGFIHIIELSLKSPYLHLVFKASFHPLIYPLFSVVFVQSKRDFYWISQREMLQLSTISPCVWPNSGFWCCVFLPFFAGFFFESHLVYDQTQGSGAVFFLLYT